MKLNLNKSNLPIHNNRYFNFFKTITLICSIFFLNFSASADEGIIAPKKLGLTSLQLTEQEQQYLKDNPFFKVVCMPDNAPFEFNISGNKRYNKYSGYNIALLSEISKVLGVEFFFLPAESLDDAIAKIVKNEATMITGYTTAIEQSLQEYGRKHGKIGTKLKFSEPVYSVPFYLLGKTSSLPAEGSSIASISLLGREKESFDELLKKSLGIDEDNIQSKVKIISFTDSFDILKCFNKKSTDYAFLCAVNYPLFESFAKTNYYRLDRSINYSHRFCFAENTPDIAIRILNKAFYSINQEDFYRIIDKTSSETKNYIESNLYRSRFNLYLLLSVSVLAAILIVILIYLNRHSSQKITETVETDELTGLISFKIFRHTARQYIKAAGKKNDYILLSIDMNHFNYINDSYGNNKGNALLIELANHFSNNIKSGELTTRFYADNFIFLLKNPGTLPGIKARFAQLTNVEEIVEKLLPKGYDVSFSAGIYYIDKKLNSSEDIVSIVDKANLARKSSKEDTLSKNTIAEYTQEMDDKVELKKEITLSMENALRDNEFEVYYQPKVQVSNGKIIGAEALIRWNRKKGLLKPNQFIEEFEKNGFIKKIDFFVLREVCKFLHEWKTKADSYPITISFNLSRIHLKDPKLVQTLTDIKNQYDIFPNKIEVELTERVMYDNPNGVVETMQDIKNAGYSISVDDFGAGYSSLNLLKDMPADVLKIDKEFFSAKNNQKENIIVSSVINMSKDLNLKTVAEGVETKDQADFLKQAGCDYIQGFYYYRPIKEGEFVAKLLDNM